MSAPDAALELPGLTGDYLRRIVERISADERFTGLVLAGSGAAGQMDEFSDLDTVLVCEDDHHQEILEKRAAFARALGPLVSSFTGDHVGEPQLLICLYGPPLLHVDLKFVALGDLARRGEGGLVVWQRDPAVSKAIETTTAAGPASDPQWIEDRFWVWVHYMATKIGRGELFECLDALNALRGIVLGPLLAVRSGHPPQGVRRLEQRVPDEVEQLTATVGDHTVRGCVAAVHATIDLYRRLRAEYDDGLRVRAEAEVAAVAYLDDVARRSDAT
jgi:hypothetical protein